MFDKAVSYYSLAIEAASSDIINMDPTILSKYYMFRSQAFEKLNMAEHAKLDLIKIQEADPNY